MQDRQECIDYDKLPDLMQALIMRIPYSGCFGASAVISYSFEAAQFMQNMFDELLAAEYIANEDALTLMNSNTRAVIRRALNLWESAAKVKFVEDNIKPAMYFFNFKPPLPNATRLGFARSLLAAPGCIGINAHIADALEMPGNFDVALHETGHGIGLAHLFDSNFTFPKHYNLTSFTIMNYDHASVISAMKAKHYIYPVGLMPVDMLAAQFIFGVNMEAHAGDDIYYLRDYNNFCGSSVLRYTITSLPWDSGGHDVVSAVDVHEPVVINIQPRGISSVNHAYIATPMMEVEHVVAGPAGNAIVLNELSNVVDLRLSKQSILFFSPDRIGHDEVFGFVPGRDRIILQTTHVDVKSSWNFTCTLAVENNIDTTVISFGQHDSIRLTGVRPDTLLNDTITTQYNPHLYTDAIKANKHYGKMLHGRVTTCPQASAYPVIEYGSLALSVTVMVSTPKIVTAIMQRNEFSDKSTKWVAAASQCIPALVRGKFATAGLLVMSNAAFDASYALHLNVGIVLATIAYESTSPVNFATKVAGTALAAVAGYGLAFFTAWGANKIINKCCNGPVERKKSL